MIGVFRDSWALLLGMLLLMVGNGLQGTLLGVRGQIEGFSTLELSVVMSAYFVGFLGGSRLAPEMIRRVGHVRVFAALASLISAVLILYPALANPYMWIVGRVIIGFCFSGVYVTAESWLNNSVSNESRGQALSVYMIVQMLGIVIAQYLLTVADPSGFILFVIPSVLVSVAFAPILLSISPTPAFDTTKPMTLRELATTSPLGCMGMFLLGGVYSVQFGMSAVFASGIGLTLGQISIFVSAFYVGATVFQYPLGWLSDKMDRRVLILAASTIGGVGAFVGFTLGENFVILVLSALVIGGMSNPLYSLLLAYTNDFLEFEDMAAASGGLVFINGVGAIAGPVITGWFMGLTGSYGYFLLIGILMFALSGYAGWRMTRRPSAEHSDAGNYSGLTPRASLLTIEAMQEAAHEAEEDAERDAGPG